MPVPHVMKEFLEEIMERRKKDRGFVGQRKLASKTEDGQIFFSEEEEQVLAFERRVGIDRALFFFFEVWNVDTAQALHMIALRRPLREREREEEKLMSEIAEVQRDKPKVSEYNKN